MAEKKSRYILSVRLMTYMHAPFIKEAMDGIMMQETDFKVEVVVGDDFSTDGTLDIIRTYSDTENIHIKILKREKGDEYWHKRQELGRLYNFTNILENCSGKYVALLDGDDYWTDPLKLQKQVDFLEKNSNYIVTCHNAKVISPTGKILKNKKLPKLLVNTSYSQQDLKRGRHLLTLTMVFRNINFSTIFKKYFLNVPNGDTFLISFLGIYGKGMFLENVQDAAYRDHSGGVWSGKSDFFKFKNLIYTYNQLYKLHSDEKSEEKVLLYFKSSLSRLSHKMILNADKNVSFKEFRDSIPIYLMHSLNPSRLIIFKSFVLLTYRKLGFKIFK